MWLIGFLDLINAGKITKIKAIGVFRAELLTNILVQGSHIEFWSRKRCSDVVFFPAIF